MSWHTDFFPYAMDTHVDPHSWPEWGSAPRGPLVDCDMAHRGELMGSVIGDDPATGKPTVYQVVRCELCIATHVWPLPSADALAAYYQRCFYAGPAAQEVAQHERDRAWYEKCVYGPVFDQCAQYLGSSVAENRPYRLMDVGAGSGIALDVAKQRGWHTVAIEPDDNRCRALSDMGHLTVHATLSQHHARVMRYAQDAIDICMLWETLEHQVCPEETLLQCYDILSHGALLVISVPNDFSPLQLAACKRYDLPHYWLIPPVHLFFWTPKTLQLCVRRCGFQILDMRGTYPLERFMLEDGGTCYVGNTEAWRAYSDRRNTMELCAVAQGTFEDVIARYRANIAQRIGRSIVCIARKV